MDHFHLFHLTLSVLSTDTCAHFANLSLKKKKLGYADLSDAYIRRAAHTDIT